MSACDLYVIAKTTDFNRNYHTVIRRFLAVDEAAFEITQHIDRWGALAEWRFSVGSLCLALGHLEHITRVGAVSSQGKG